MAKVLKYQHVSANDGWVLQLYSLLEVKKGRGAFNITQEMLKKGVQNY